MDFATEFAVGQVMVAEPMVVALQLSLQEVVQRMNARRVGAVLVLEEKRLVGIFTERDLLTHAAGAPPGWWQRPVSDWMTPNPQTIGSHASWESAMNLMEYLHVRHLPMVDDGRLVGILSARDLMARRADYLNRMIEVAFGTERLQQLMCKHGSASARELVQELAHRLTVYRGARPPSDDLTILAADVR